MTYILEILEITGRSKVKCSLVSDFDAIKPENNKGYEIFANDKSLLNMSTLK